MSNLRKKLASDYNVEGGILAGKEILDNIKTAINALSVIDEKVNDDFIQLMTSLEWKKMKDRLDSCYRELEYDEKILAKLVDETDY